MRRNWLLVLISIMGLIALLTGMPGSAKRAKDTKANTPQPKPQALAPQGLKPPSVKLQGLKPQVARAVKTGESKALRDMPRNREVVAPSQQVNEGNVINERNTAIERVQRPGAPHDVDAAIRGTRKDRATTREASVTPAPTGSFEGLADTDNATASLGLVNPPDTNADVGYSQIVETVNAVFRVYDKTGAPITPVLKQSDLFASVGGQCSISNPGDPVVLHDRIADRWQISQFNFAGSGDDPPFHQCIAISKTSDAAGEYYLYDFITPAGNNFPDYPKLAVWPDAYYMSTRQFDADTGAFQGLGAFAFNRAKMLAGDPTAELIFFAIPFNANYPSGTSSGMIPSDHDGILPPPPGAPNVFAIYDSDEFGADDEVHLFDFHADFTTPANSTFTERPESPIDVPAFNDEEPAGRADIEEPAPGERLDSIPDRLMFRMAYRNRGGVESLVTNHTVNVSGVTVTSAATYQAASRYYEFRKSTPGGAYTVYDAATYAPDAGNGATGINRWMGSTAIDDQGNLAMGYSLSSTTALPSIAYVGRAFDQLGASLTNEQILFPGQGTQAAGSGNRWGDYTSMSVDPTDDCTFWYANEYYPPGNTGFNWHTRIGNFKFPTCSAPAQGTLVGTITACDSGAPIGEVKIDVTGGPSDGYSTATADDGTYTLHLAPGTYTVTASSGIRDCQPSASAMVTITDGGTATFSTCLNGTANIILPEDDPTPATVSGGNGNGQIDKNECNILNVAVQNAGCAPARNVVSTLSTTTPGVTITQPSSPYPNIPIDGVATNTIPFGVSTSPSFVCGTPIDFTLTLTYTGGSDVLTFTLETCQLPPAPFSGTIQAGDTQTTNGRLGRNGVPANCAGKVCPGPLGAGGRSYDTFNFVNQGGVPACVTVNTQSACGAIIFTGAYLGSFDPTNLCTNYLGDAGASSTNSNFDVTVPAGATVVVVVMEANAGTTCAYTGSVSGLLGNTDGGGECADLSVTKDSSPDPVTAGNDLTYTITVGNSGPGAGQTVALSDVIPANTTFVSAAQTTGPAFTLGTPPVGGTGSFTANIATFANGATATFELVVNVDSSTSSGTILSNTASLSAANDSNTENNSATETTSVIQPTLTINDVSVTEGNAGATNAVFTVTLTPSSMQTVTVDYFTANGTAMEPSDYTAVNGPLTFAPGVTTRTITVPVNGDTTPEADETYFVRLMNPFNGAIGDGEGLGTIINDDPGGTLEFSSSTYNVSEAAGSKTITVTRTGSVLGTVTVNFATSNGTATAGLDYGNSAGTLSFGPGITSQTFDVPILEDSLSEGTESVNLTLSGPTGGATIGTQNQAVLLINDNEPPVPSSVNVYAVTVSNNLLSFNSAAPDVLLNSVAITGLQALETVLGIDFRPTSGQLYALGSSSRLYTVNTTTGVATAIDGPFSIPLVGGDFGDDFNPLVDRLRVVSDSDQNLRVNPSTGAVVSPADTSLAYASGDSNFGANPNVVGAAYTNSFVGNINPSVTTLYGIDSNLDTLVLQGSINGTPTTPNSGQLTTVGSLGVNTTGLVGFDIQGSNNRAFASLSGPGESSSKLYTLNLGNGSATLIGTIAGGELIRDVSVAGGTFQFSTTNATVAENGVTVTLTVTRDGNTSIASAVNFATSDGTATQKGDYTIALGTLQFAAGETTKSFDISIVNDGIAESSEDFTVSLSSATNDFALSGNTTATVTITDVGDPTATNPIDESVFFVRQHYLDFLGREPDAPGQTFWVNDIESCGADAQCRAVKRIDVSAAFFLSIEFQDSGFSVIRLQRVAFGKKSNDASLRMSYLQFMRDARQVSQGVIVGSGNWQQQLELNKQAYAAQLVTSSAFEARFPISLSASAYVDALFASADLSPTASERNAAINAFNTAGGGTAGRVAALRSAADANTVGQAEFNPSFVMMQYYGYLRRNSTDPPDNSSDAGYQFWLTKLNQFNGDFRQAEMVKAFISSAEYRDRFR